MTDKTQNILEWILIISSAGVGISFVVMFFALAILAFRSAIGV